MAAAAGATGARTWLQAHHRTWLTPRRMRIATLLLIAAAFVVSSLGISGSGSGSPTAPSAHQTSPSAASVLRDH